MRLDGERTDQTQTTVTNLVFPAGEDQVKHAKYFVVSYGIKLIVLTPNFSQEYPLRRIYRRSLPLYKITQ